MGMSLWAESRSRGPLKWLSFGRGPKQLPRSARRTGASWALLRDLRKAAGYYRSTRRPARMPPRPPDRRSTPTSEAGFTVADQFLDLVEFYVLRAPHRDGAKPDEDLRAQGIAAVSRALGLPVYHVAAAQGPIARMQPRMRRKRRSSASTTWASRSTIWRAPSSTIGARWGSNLPSGAVDQGVEEVLFPAGASFIQLLGSLGADTPVGRFLATRGPGVHHVAYRVDDVVASLARFRGEGVRLVDEVPRRGSRDTRTRSSIRKTWAACSSSWCRWPASPRRSRRVGADPDGDVPLEASVRHQLVREAGLLVGVRVAERGTDLAFAHQVVERRGLLVVEEVGALVALLEVQR